VGVEVSEIDLDIFVLIKSLEKIEMRFPDESLIVDCKNEGNRFGTNLSELRDAIQSIE